MLPLEEWDQDYVVDEVADLRESESFERKAAEFFSQDRNRRPGIAKEICAFANSGGGFLVFGLHDSGGLDAGVPETMGRQPATSWIEALIPSWHQPPITDCGTRFIQTRLHAADHGVIAVHVPLSSHRPHWSVLESPEVAYLRIGEHSAPMRIQTLLDVASRGTVSIGAIEDIVMRKNTDVEYWLNPRIRIEAGPACSEWAYEVSVANGAAEWYTADQARYVSEGTLFFRGGETLFPHRWTRVYKQEFSFYFKGGDATQTVTATLYLGSSIPVTRKWTIRELLDKSVPA